jgi:hypothetical protein
VQVKGLLVETTGLFTLGREFSVYRPWSEVCFDPLHRATQTVKLADGGVFEEPLMVARDLNPMPSKHFHVRGFKSQLELRGNVVMQQFASLYH